MPKLSSTDLEYLQHVVDEAHNEATSWVFERCEELRKVREAEGAGFNLADNYSNEDIQMLLVRLAWIGTVFKSMEAVDKLRK